MSLLILALAQVAVPAPTTAVAPADKPKTICIHEPVIGSRVKGKRICFTKEEYAAYLAVAKAELRTRQKTDDFEGAKGSCMRGVDC